MAKQSPIAARLAAKTKTRVEEQPELELPLPPDENDYGEPELDEHGSARRRKKGAKGGRKTMRGVVVYVSPETHRALSMISFKEDKSKQDLMIEAMNMLLEHYGEMRIA